MAFYSVVGLFVLIGVMTIQYPQYGRPFNILMSNWYILRLLDPLNQKDGWVYVLLSGLLYLMIARFFPND